jgi:hypothetical protein
MENYKDITWSVDFEITVDGEEKNFWELSEAAQEYIISCIAGDSYSGTFTDISN